MNEPNKKDVEHLRQLSIFHFTAAGLALAGLLFLAGHYAIMSSVFNDPAVMAKMNKDSNLPANFFHMFIWFYVVFGTFVIVSGIANVISAIFLRQRRHRTFSFIVAGLNCLHMPLGTVLGVFTFVVLGRESVIQMYEAKS
jgi:hypothetical protein